MFDKKVFAVALGIACLSARISCMEHLPKEGGWGVENNAKAYLQEHRAALAQKGFTFDDEVLDMPFDNPLTIFPALKKCYIQLPELGTHRVPLSALIKNEQAKSAVIEGLQELPLEVLEFFEYLGYEGCSFLSTLPKGMLPVEAAEFADIIYDTFHQAAASKRTYFGQFARLTLGGKVTVGVGAVFAGLGVIKTIEWFQGPKPEKNPEAHYAY
jgi:hypothetical protein